MVEQKAPAIETVLDPRQDSRVDPDPAAQLVAEQQITAQLSAEQLTAAPQQDDAARQQGEGDEDEDNIVGDSDEDAKATEGGPDEDPTTAKTAAENPASAKTADTSGDTDVDITE